MAKKSTSPKSSTGKKAGAKKTARKSAKKSTAGKAADNTTGKAAKTAKKVAKKAVAKSTAKKNTAGKAAKKTATKKVATKKTPGKKTASKKTAVAKGTSSKKTAPRSRKTVSALAAIPSRPLTDASGKLIPQVKNPALTAKQKRTLKELLENERDRILTFLQEVDHKSLNHKDDRDRDRSSYSIHQADFASDNQALNLALAQRQIEAQRLEEVEHALKMVSTKNFGKCRRCAANIGFDRMSAKPYAEYCIACRRQLEPGRGDF